MKLLKSTAAIAAILAVSYANNTTSAATFTSVTDGDWNKGATWGLVGNDEGTHYPGANDDAIISTGDRVDIGSMTVSVNSLVIRDIASGTPGILEMQDSGVLQIESSIDVEDSETVPGVLRFVGTTGTPGELRAAAAGVTLDGPYTVPQALGAKFGFDLSNDSFSFQSGATLSTASGDVTISSLFTNNGVLDATSGDISITGTFTNNLDAILRSTGGAVTVSGASENDGIYQVNGANMTISGQLDTASTGMFRLTSNHTMTFQDGSEVTGDISAHFNVQDGTLLFNGSHSTDGGFEQTGGTVQVDANESFEAKGLYNSGAGT
ncbi:MAG: DUF4097 domain-containing protein [Phycisphaerales bacterium]|nr:DUF4097 domain-containing protein [Phycisphaerales bacterium]